MIETNFYGRGKLLICSEYFVLDGAKALALPTTLGQNLSISYKRSNAPKLHWESYDSSGKLWFSCSFDLWHFSTDDQSAEAFFLQRILKQARLQNIHFLREEVDVVAKTQLEFNLFWGLGSSSTLIYNIAQWAYISPYELQEKTLGGSGYDIACAEARGPILFEKRGKNYSWEQVEFNPIFKDQIFFAYLNRKTNTKTAVDYYYSLNLIYKKKIINKLNLLCDKIVNCFDIRAFEELIFEHENLIADNLKLPLVKEELFHDFDGAIKSLGAWGGDFALVASSRDNSYVRSYFQNRGHQTLFSYDELVYQQVANTDGSQLGQLHERRI